MSKKHTVFLLLGSNIHPRRKFLEKAEQRLRISLGQIVQSSSVYVSDPWGFDAPVAFLNRVLVMETTKKPGEILRITQAIERELGRSEKSKNGRYASRTLDIDLLYFDDNIIRSKGLMVPHPRLQERRFTLLPLTEIAPDWVHPVLKRNNRQLLAECKDQGKVWKFNEMPSHAV